MLTYLHIIKYAQLLINFNLIKRKVKERIQIQKNNFIISAVTKYANYRVDNP